MKKIVTVVGARPQFIKLAVVSRVLRQQPEFQEVLVHTGQHYDHNMSDVFFDEMDIPKPDYNLSISGGSHGQMTGKMLIEIEKVLMKEQPDLLLVFGDTNSTMAAALAAVVLYNLISVNLAERKKELATIKVLGFFDKEVYRYIFREIDLLALMGSCVGLLLGIPLHQFIIRTVEMDQLMFIRTIAPHSYLLSVALTMIFTLVVCFVMRRHVKKISMVESMKAPE